MPDTNHSVSAIYAAAAEKSGKEQAAYLDEACGGDAALRQRVERLLRAGTPRGDAADFLESPASELDLTEGPTVAERAGGTVGGYKLLEQVGEGGFGVVFRAEQVTPVRRQVALKVIKPGMDTKQVIARFEAERQALALMDHPNIARVLDAGATESGRPYFVMELVRGVPITEFCDANLLGTRERLGLFVDVCRAVQHAHQKGVIHRDLKPSNVLVTMHDDRPVPKVIDFGIAKATQARLTEQTLFTAFRQFVGTPQYTSPEQAQMSGLDVDTRSDVYSLGVLLYELLTGTTPLDPKELRAAALDRIQQMIREAQPPRPSTRLSTMGQRLATIAAQRKADPKKLPSIVRGELDWIVMKCLEKDRARRYESASALATDVTRHLDGRVVLARPPSTLYRLSKVIRQHRAAVAGAAVVTVGILVALVVAGYGLRKAHRALDAEAGQKRVAQAREADANRQAANAAAVSAFLREMLGAANPNNPPSRGANVRVRDLLNGAVQRLDSGGIDDPLIEADIRMSLGSVYLGLGLNDPARVQLERVVALRRANLGAQTEEVAEALAALSGSLTNGNNLESGEATARASLEIYRRLLGDEHPSTDAAAYALGRALARKNHAAAREWAAERIAIVRRLPDAQRERLGAWLNVLAVTSDFDELLFRQSIAEYRVRHPKGTAPMVFPLQNLAGLLQDRGQTKESRQLYQEAWGIADRTMGPEHSYTVQVLCNLISARNSDPASAANDYRRTTETYRQRLGPDDPAVAWLLWGGAIHLRGFPEERETAIGFLREAIATWQRGEGEDSPSAGARMLDLAYTLHMHGKDDECEALYRRSLAARRKSDSPADVGECLFRLAEFLTDRRDYAGAEAAWLEMRDWRAAHRSYSGLPTELEINQQLAGVYQAWGNPQRMADVNTKRDEMIRAASAELKKSLNSRDPAYASALEARAALNATAGHFREAAADYQELFTLDPTRHLWLYRRAAIVAYLGDRETWARLSKEMFDRFGTWYESETLERTGKLCLVMDPPAADPKHCLALIETAMEARKNYNWFVCSHALALYRNKDYRGSVAAARRAKELDVNGPPVQLLADLVLSMAHHRLGESEQAAAAWKRADERIREQFRPPPEGDPGQYSLEDFMFVHLLHAEADSLLHVGPQGSPAR
jgi:serine/threonine protein kinase/tetratricopeptide (TPR) repeat protein